jgi:hypothetical protein
MIKYFFGAHIPSYNTALPKLAKMNVIMTLRQCLGRYMKPYAKSMRTCTDLLE